MSGKSHKVRNLFISLVLAIIIALGASVFWLDSIVKNGINTYGSKIAGTDIEVSDVKIGFDGSVGVKGLRIANPKGFSEGDVLKVDDIFVKVDIPSVLSDLITVENIDIKGADFSYEVKGINSNVAALLENFESSAGTKDAKEEEVKPVEPVSEAPAKQVYIKKLSVTGSSVALALTSKDSSGDLLNLPLPDITLNDIGKPDDGVSFAEAVAEVMGKVTSNIVTAIVDKTNPVASSLSDNVKSGVETVKSWFN